MDNQIIQFAIQLCSCSGYGSREALSSASRRQELNGPTDFMHELARNSGSINTAFSIVTDSRRKMARLRRYVVRLYYEDCIESIRSYYSLLRLPAKGNT